MSQPHNVKELSKCIGYTVVSIAVMPLMVLVMGTVTWWQMLACVWEDYRDMRRFSL